MSEHVKSLLTELRWTAQNNDYSDSARLLKLLMEHWGVHTPNLRPHTERYRLTDSDRGYMDYTWDKILRSVFRQEEYHPFRSSEAPIKWRIRKALELYGGVMSSACDPSFVQLHTDANLKLRELVEVCEELLTSSSPNAPAQSNTSLIAGSSWGPRLICADGKKL